MPSLLGPAGIGCGVERAVVWSKRRAAISRRSDVHSSDPKPGTLSGIVKSHWFSANPTKSRIVGSVSHARRSAARAISSGTPGAKKARMSLAAVIESSGGSVAGSKTGVEDSVCAGTLSATGPSTLPESSTLAPSFKRGSAARLRCDHRRKNSSNALLESWCRFIFDPWMVRAVPSLLGLVRSRVRLTNRCAKGCAATKSATMARTESGIVTASTRLAPLSVKDSPSLGSAVTAATS